MKSSEYGSANLTHGLNASILRFFRKAVTLSLAHPSFFFPALRLMHYQRAAARRRARFQEEGTQVPPFLIVSVTKACNLTCSGCYARSFSGTTEGHMDRRLLIRTLSEAQELGISYVIIAGGEPLAHPDLLEIIGGFPRLVFLIFTNGLLLEPSIVHRFRTMRNVVPVLSLEGDEKQTDARRGSGVYRQVMYACELLNKYDIFFGVSLTTTQENFAMVTDDGYVQDLVARGCRLYFFVEYVPVAEHSLTHPPSMEQRRELLVRIDTLSDSFPSLFVAFPGSEEQFGGCLSSGRGFVHVNASGGLEPCPFAPYSDVSLANVSLQEALQSRFLSSIRGREDLLKETTGGCALWVHRGEVEQLLNRGGLPEEKHGLKVIRDDGETCLSGVS